MKVEIIWHKFSYPDSMPPLNTGILITNGEIVTVAFITKDWNQGKWSDYTLNGHGWWGYEWEHDFDIIDITYWALLPDVPKG